MKRCQVSAERSSTPDAVPAEFRQAHARVVSVTRRGEGFAAQMLYDHSVTQVYAAIKRAVAAAGYKVVREENEGRDAELFLDHDGTPFEVRLSAIRVCPQYATATVASEAGSG